MVPWATLEIYRSVDILLVHTHTQHTQTGNPKIRVTGTYLGKNRYGNVNISEDKHANGCTGGQRPALHKYVGFLPQF